MPHGLSYYSWRIVNKSGLRILVQLAGVLVPWTHFYIRFCATYTLVETLCVYWRCTAPKSIAACKPENVSSLCDAMSNHYVSVKCTTNNEEMWVPASSAWPSVLIIICFTALYFWYLSWKYETRNEFNSIIKVNCTINFVGLMMILTIAFIAVYYKWAVRNAVWVGSCIGIGGAIWDGDFRIP